MMTNKRVILLAVLILLALSLMAAVTLPAVYLKANQSVTIYCQGDELILTPYGENQVDIVCREWVRR